MQETLQTGGVRVGHRGKDVVLSIGKIGLTLPAKEAADLGLMLQAEAEEIRRVEELEKGEAVAVPAPEATPVDAKVAP